MSIFVGGTTNVRRQTYKIIHDSLENIHSRKNQRLLQRLKQFGNGSRCRKRFKIKK